MTPSPLVSVVVAAHNRAGFLRETVYSTLNQSLRDIEVLIVDDASTDTTSEVARRLMSEDSRVRLLQLRQNAGPSTARNVALDEACGIYIAILDADDICMPTRFERQIAFLHQTGVDLCGSWFVEFGKGPPRKVRWPHSEPALRAAMLFQYAVLHPSVLARREVFDRFRYTPELRLAEDYDLCVRVMSEFRIASVPDALVRYRRHSGQATLTQRAKMEEVTRRIRLDALQVHGIEPSEEEQRTHNQIRAPQSIRSTEDFERIEAWLLKLINRFDHPDAQHAIASQWTRAAVRAAPLGQTMLRKYRGSPLYDMLNKRLVGDMDMAALAILRLDYCSRAFEALRRFGLSA